MRKISVEEAIDILGQKGFKESKILKMKLDKFIDVVNEHIGEIESTAFINRKSLGKQYSTNGKWVDSKSLLQGDELNDRKK